MTGAPGREQIGEQELRAAITAYRDALRAHRDYLNRLNVYPVPDGDTGTNMALTLESVVAELDGVQGMAATCKAISHGSLMGARGNSGVILSQILRGLTDVLKETEQADGATMAAALTHASATAYEAVMRPVEGTILTVVREASEAAAAGPPAPLVDTLEAAATAARRALEETPKLLPILADAGVVDAGGAGFVLFLDVLLNVTTGRPVPEPPAWVGEVLAQAAEHSTADGGDDDLRYEVMYLLEAPDATVPPFKEAWAALGDSIVVTGGDGLWNCHIHTNEVGPAIEAALDVGRPRRIQVTDMAGEVEEERWVKAELGASKGLSGPSERETQGTDATSTEATLTAVVAVGGGDGVERILRSLGVASVVAGGQAMNPSTREILEAVERAGAEQVVIVPNNRNIVPVARQVDALTAKSVAVVETGSVAEGFAALLGFHPDADLDTNVRAMAEAVSTVSTGEVTQAVRDAATPAGPVKRGDHLGVAREGILVCAPTAAEAACALLERLVDDDHEIVTIIEGADASPDDTRIITDWLSRERPKCSSEVHRGDQPLSSYLFSVE